MICLAMFLILMTGVSASIIITDQPDEIYSMGDSLEVPVTVKSLESVSGVFSMDLICNGNIVNFYKSAIMLEAGDEKKINPLLILSKSMIGDLSGTCNVKAFFGEEYTLSDDSFVLSSKISINLSEFEDGLNPGDSIYFEGTALKENGDSVNGIVEFFILDNGSESFNGKNTVQNGFFSYNVDLPEDFESGKKLMKINVYEEEKVDGVLEKTNEGLYNSYININSIPTSLEIILEDEIDSFEDLEITTILHDQTGEKIPANVKLVLRDSYGKLLEQFNIPTGEVFNYDIDYKIRPTEWIVEVEYEDLFTERSFDIIEYKKIEVELINDTVLISNVGNVIYNDSVLVEIGEENFYVKTFLDVGEFQEYILSAPNGEYQIGIVVNGEDRYSGTAILTGNSINVKQVTSKVVDFVRHPLVWIFILLIIGFIAYMIYRKGYKKSIFGKNKSLSSGEVKRKAEPLRKGSLVNAVNRAELSLSIAGQKQAASVVCLRIKNLKDIESKKGATSETLQKIVSLAESRKAFVYENASDLFFMLAPLKTKTFKNDETALELVKEIKRVLEHDNKLFKHKIDYGLSVNSGSIIAKDEMGILKFMSVGTLVTTAKRIAAFSDGEPLLSREAKEKLISMIKVEKTGKEGLDVYKVTQFKKGSGDNKKFINSFLKRIEKDKK